MQKLNDLSVSAIDLINEAELQLNQKNSEPLQTVVASARTKSGNIFSAINLYHFTGGPCAESVLMAKTLSENESLDIIVAVHYDDDGNVEIINPCGRCRQMFSDYEPNANVIVDDKGTGKIVTVSDLLPYSYSNKAVEYQRVTNSDKKENHEG